MKDQIFKKLVQRYASESTTTLKEAAYNLSLANVVEGEFWDRAEKAINKIRQHQASGSSSILSEAAKKATNSALSICPICKNKMNLVKLLDDKQAFYCTDHKICQPLPVTDGE